MKRLMIALAAYSLAAHATAKEDINSIVGGFAAAVAASSIASAQCAGMKEDTLVRDLIWHRIASEGGSEAQLRTQVAVYAVKMGVAFSKEGSRKWCAAAWNLFGPDAVVRTIRAK